MSHRVTRGRALIGKAGLTTIVSGGTSLILAALADAAGTTVTFSAANAAFGDFVLLGSSKSLSGVTVNAYVHAAGTVGIRFQNESGGTVSLGTATYSYLVVRK